MPRENKAESQPFSDRVMFRKVNWQERKFTRDEPKGQRKDEKNNIDITGIMIRRKARQNWNMYGVELNEILSE